MEVSMNSLAVNCLYSLLMGIFLGLSYDIVRVIRAFFCVSDYGCRNIYEKVYKGKIKNYFDVSHGRVFKYIFITVTDILFFVYGGVCYALFLYVVNYGIFRWFFLFFSAVGFVLNRITVGKIMIKLFDYLFQTLRLIINIIILILNGTVRLLISPFWHLRIRFPKKLRVPFPKK